ncbi:Tripartite tricarboxylate transporter TctA family protein [Tsuneonella dongtanensis]|uniref:Tripartite tricarboxylate transporter TctA family protein n=1 Tax=Tsuneonella dongtanensis TaxID=692370 RepID=A0A1B2AGH2_9SPHN|nr:tripartite tricarboxylate transporter permease [Tsuneonella dongtanensis]ANY21208.1 Tripartite tricarboxylate transporter TctA family protein [Tsuneonella dongtanensis]
MDLTSLIANMSAGFGVALSPDKLVFGLLGVLIGTAVGVLPGLGPSVAIALLLPLTFGLEPTTAFILFGGIYYGTMYGGSTTSILINTPGDAAASVSTFEGYPMAKKGLGGVALATSAIGSFIGGTFATFMLMLAASSLAAATLWFGPPEYFAMMVLALAMVTGMAGRSLPRALLALSIGLGLAMVGIDMQTGANRLTFGVQELYGGIDIALGAVGLFAVGEALWLIAAPPGGATERLPTNRLLLTLDEWRRSAIPWLRGTVVGFLSGLLPGTGATFATFLSYGVERKFSKHPEQFGKGAIEGLAGPEAANNAAAGASMVPLLALGIPGSATTAIMLVAFQLYGLQPGPTLMETNKDLVWGLIASLYVANVLLVILNLPLVGLWVQLLRIPKGLLTAIILVFSTVGAYSLQGSLGDVVIVWLLGIAAFLLRRFGVPIAPVLLGLVLGPMLEQDLRRTLAMSSGDFGIFLTRPIALGVFALIAVLAVYRLVGVLRLRKAAAEARLAST